MQILISYDKTYTIDIDPLDTILELKEKIKHKTILPIESQTLIYNGKIIEQSQFIKEYKIESGDCIRVFCKLPGGNFISTGNLIITLLISLISYFISFPFLLEGLNMFLIYSNSKKSNTNLNDGSSNNQTQSGIEQYLNNSNIGLEWQDGSKSVLFIVYFILNTIFWLLYSGTVPQIFYAYYKCEKVKPNQSSLVLIVLLALGLILSYPILLFLRTKFNFIRKYTVSIFNIITLIVLGIYYIYTLQSYTFSIWYYSLLSILMLFIFLFIGEGRYKYIITPMIASIIYITIYLSDYFRNFEHSC